MQYVETPIKDATEIIQRITCPDKSSCPDGMTCCKGNDGRYGCCPAPNAVCCKFADDHCCRSGETCCEIGCCPFNGVCCNDPGDHCCPHGTQCDVEHRSCRGSQFLPILMSLFKNDMYPPMEKVLKLVFHVMDFLLVCRVFHIKMCLN